MLRIIWQYDPKRIQPNDLFARAARAAEMIDLPPGLRYSPVFSGARGRLAVELLQLDEPVRRNPENDLTRYYQAFPNTDDEAGRLLEALAVAKEGGLVVGFELQRDIGPSFLKPSQALEVGSPCVRSPGPDGDSLLWEPCQRYLAPAAASPQLSGVDARFAWRLMGGKGDGIRMVDVEEGCNPHHEDLEGQVGSFLGRFDPHGTAVLGILCGNPENQVGVTGIAHHARVRLASFKIQEDGDLPNPEDVIYQATQWLRPGDVLLIEVGAVRPGMVGGNSCSAPYLPMEAWKSGRAAIDCVLNNGIYVVEVAANGGLDLDDVPDMPSSGLAMMVGAGSPQTGEALLCSNRGSRVDLQGWGGRVVTAGSPPEEDDFSTLQFRNDPNRCYTKSFSGTSSAAAIVAGCVAVISGIVKAHEFDPLSPDRMKKLLIDHGTFPDRGANNGIGPLPNLRASLGALEEELRDERPSFDRFKLA
jgi:hypothetical protein